MRLAYIIVAHKLPDLLVRLVYRLQSPDATFFIHVDKKSSPEMFRQMQDGVKHFSNVYFLKRRTVHYREFGQVEASLEGIRELLARGTPFDYAILLTGQDYPLKTNGAIEDFFSRNQGKSFIGYTSLPDANWPAMHRLEHWHFRILNTPIEFPLNVQGRRRSRMFVMMKKIANLLFARPRSFLPNMKPYGGEAYWNLSREAIRYSSDYVGSHPGFVRFFRNVSSPAEFFFQTLLLNSPLKDEICKDSLRYVDWSGKGQHPAILTEDDFETLRSSSMLFARKFDTSVDSHILDMIDKQLLRE